MNAIERAEYEKLEKLVDHWQVKFYKLMTGGVYSARRAMNRMKRKEDLSKAYVLAAEEVWSALDVIDEHGEWTPMQRLAFSRLKAAREDLGLVKREHTAEQCGGNCKYHRRGI